MSDCIICKIIANELPSYTIYEDDDFKVILDRFPSSLGHTLIVSKKHIPDIYELDHITASKVLPLAARIARALKEALSCDGLNLLQNNSPAAGQTIPHFHLHLIPRYENDTVKICWQNQDPTSENFEGLLAAIEARFN